jgi:hypothetical protein
MSDISTIKSKVKRALMIPLDETYADDEIELHIKSCRQLIRSAGCSEAIACSENGLVEALVLIYCKTFYGFTNDGGVKELPPSFDFLLRQLVLTGEE